MKIKLYVSVDMVLITKCKYFSNWTKRTKSVLWESKCCFSLKASCIELTLSGISLNPRG